MEQALSIIGKVLMATYTICLPMLLAWVHESKKEKKKQREFMVQSVESINNTVKGLIEKIEMNEAMTSRYRIIRAADEIRNGGELSDDAVEQLAEDLDLYDTFCENHPGYKNHKGRNSRRIVIEYEEKLNEKRRKES